MNIFIDTSNRYLILILESNKKIIDSLMCNGEGKHTEQTMEKINIMFKKNGIKWNDILAIYTTSGPGSYTGVRVGLTIAKTIKIINQQIKVYVINSLLYQIGNLSGISALDARNNQSYIANFKICKQIGDVQIVNNDEIDKSKLVVLNYNKINYVNNFLILKNYFIEIKNINDYKIKYYKFLA